MRERLTETYQTHRRSLFTLALSITGCRQLAEDAVHSAFERLWRTKPQTDGNLVSYVFASVRNSARDALNAKQRANKVPDSIFNGRASHSTNDDPSEDIVTAERDQILRSAVEELNSEEREVVVLKAFSELTFDDLGEVLGVPAKTAATRYRRALIKLEEKLRGQL